MTCPGCSSELPSPKFKFCPFCGAAIGAPAKPAREVTGAGAARPAGGTTGAAARAGADTIAEPTAAVAETGPATLFGRPPARAALVSDTLPEPAPAVRTTGNSAAPTRTNSRAGGAKSAPAKSASPERSATPLGGATIVDPPHARPDSEAATIFELPAIDAAALGEAVEMKRQGSKAGMPSPVRTDEIDSAILEGAIRAAPRIREDDRPTVLNLAAVTGFDETRDHPAVSPARTPTPRSTAAKSASTSAAPSPGAPAPDARAASAAERAPASPKRTTTAAPRTSTPKAEPAASRAQPAASTGSPKVGVPQPSPSEGERKKFSETAWFMAAVNPAELAEREGAAQGPAEAEDMTERYAVEAPLPEEVRSKFSLRGILGRSSKKKP